MDISFLDKIQSCFGKSQVKPEQYSSLALAYIGDGVFDLIIRTVVLDTKVGKVKDLHRNTSNIVKAPSQAQIIKSVMEELTAEEMAVYRRGRNTKSATSAKNSSILDYRTATGFETLIGYLYLHNRLDRALDIIKLGMERTGFLPLHL